MSLYPKWAGAVPAGDPRGENPVLKSSDRPGSRGTDRRSWKDNNRFKNRSLPNKYCSSINTFLFRWGQFCNFLLPIKHCKNLWRTTSFNLARPVGPWWRVASLYIHTRGRLEDNAEAAPSIPTSPHSLICISMTHREHFAF